MLFRIHCCSDTQQEFTRSSRMSRAAKFLISLLLSSSTVNLSASPVSILSRENIAWLTIKEMRSTVETVTPSDCNSAASLRNVKVLRGGSTASNQESTLQLDPSNPAPVKENSLRKTTMKNLLAGWGVIQVLSILANAIKRVVPIAIQPILQRDLQPTQVVIGIIWCVYMLYTEGYKTFQQKFSPLVVKRAFGLSKNPSIMKVLFAGPYSMGLFGATRKRMIVSWSVTLGVFAIVKIVKKLPYPWRSIVDAGVVLGLTYGALAMCFQTVRAMFGYIPDVDECLPLKNDEKAI